MEYFDLTFLNKSDLEEYLSRSALYLIFQLLESILFVLDFKIHFYDINNCRSYFKISLHILLSLQTTILLANSTFFFLADSTFCFLVDYYPPCKLVTEECYLLCVLKLFCLCIFWCTISQLQTCVILFLFNQTDFINQIVKLKYYDFLLFSYKIV